GLSGVTFGGINFGGQIQSVSGVNMTSGTLLVSNDVALGADAGSTLNVNGGIYNPTNTPRSLTLTGGGVVNINSAITAATGTLNQVYSLNKYGTGTTNITTAQPAIFTSGINVNGGTLALLGAGTLSGGTITAYVKAGGKLLVNDSGTAIANRLGGRRINLDHGIFQYVVNGGTASSESLGTLSSNSGANVVQVTTSGQNSTLTFDSFSYPTGSTFLFRADGTGAAFGTNANKVVFTTAPTLSNGLIYRSVVIDANGTNFSTYSANGVGAFTAYNTSNSLLTSAATDTSLLTTSAVTNTRTLNALATNGANVTVGAASGSQTLTLTTGGLLVAGGTTSIARGLTLNAGTNPLALWVADGASLAVAGQLATTGFTVSKNLGG
ncbi:MAG: hypothetical protein EBV83_10485, partial [Verrucomicrobia bacterium]|nr:hypothetical protein [Verrucomicrobiota bacterium]